MATHTTGDDELLTETVWREFGESLRGFVRGRVNNADDADEIVQEVFVRLHRNIAEIDEPAGWMYRVARNAIIDFYRSAHQRREVTSAPDVLPELPALEDVDDVVWQRFVESVGPLMSGLSDLDREALSLVDLQGVSQAQVARDLGISNSGLKSRVQRARGKFRAALEACCEIELDARGRLIDMTPRTDSDEG